VVLSEPAAPQLLVECDALPEKCVGLLVHELAVFEQGIGVTIIGDLDVRDLVCKTPFEADRDNCFRNLSDPGSATRIAPLQTP